METRMIEELHLLERVLDLHRGLDPRLDQGPSHVLHVQGQDLTALVLEVDQDLQDVQDLDLLREEHLPPILKFCMSRSSRRM